MESKDFPSKFRTWKIPSGHKKPTKDSSRPSWGITGNAYSTGVVFKRVVRCFFGMLNNFSLVLFCLKGPPNIEKYLHHPEVFTSSHDSQLRWSDFTSLAEGWYTKTQRVIYVYSIHVIGDHPMSISMMEQRKTPVKQTNITRPEKNGGKKAGRLDHLASCLGMIHPGSWLSSPREPSSMHRCLPRSSQCHEHEEMSCRGRTSMPFPTERPPDMEKSKRNKYFPSKPMAKEPEKSLLGLKENHLSFASIFGVRSTLVVGSGNSSNPMVNVAAYDLVLYMLNPWGEMEKIRATPVGLKSCFFASTT